MTHKDYCGTTSSKSQQMSEPYRLVMGREEIDEDEFSDTELAILDQLEEGRGTPSYIAEEIEKSQPYVRERLKELTRLEIVRKVHHGLYELAEENEK